MTFAKMTPSDSILLWKSALTTEDGTDRQFTVPGVRALRICLSLRRASRDDDTWCVALSVVKPRTLAPRLTPRERDILDLALTGVGNRKIALLTGLSPVTVGCYLTRIYRKFGVASRIELLATLLSDAVNPGRKILRMPTQSRRARQG